MFCFSACVSADRESRNRPVIDVTRSSPRSAWNRLTEAVYITGRHRTMCLSAPYLQAQQQTPSRMLFKPTIALAALTGLVSAAPFSLPNGFPTLGDAALHQVYEVSP